MQLLDGGQQVATRPTPNPTAAPGWANNDLSGATPPTIADPDAWNALMAEVLSVMTAAGQTPSKTNVSQLWQSLFSSHAFPDIGSANHLQIALPSGLSYPSTAQVFGSSWRVRIANANTGPADFAPMGLPAVPIVLPNGGALVGNELLPDAIVELFFDGTNWRVLSGGGGLQTTVTLIANTEVYVDAQLGLDTNPGTSAAPWQTFNRVNTYLLGLNFNGYTVSINASGAFTGEITIQGSYLGAVSVGSLIINWAAGSSITTAAGNCITATNGAAFTSNGPVTFVNNDPANGYAVWSDLQARLKITGGPIFGACKVAHIGTNARGVVTIDGNYPITGNAPTHFDANDGTIEVGTLGPTAMIITLSTGLTFSGQFALAGDNGTLRCSSATVSFAGGAATGVKYFAKSNGVIETSGSGASFFPGNSAGATQTGGQFL